MPILMTLRMRLPVCPFHSPLRTRLEKCRHLVEHGMDLRHDILAVDEDGCAFGRAQGHVQDRALFRDVDLVSAKHGVDPRSQSRFLGQFEEELEGFVGDAILRVIEEEARSLGASFAPRAWDRLRRAVARCNRESFRSGFAEPSTLCASVSGSGRLRCGAWCCRCSHFRAPSFSSNCFAGCPTDCGALQRGAL